MKLLWLNIGKDGKPVEAVITDSRDPFTVEAEYPFDQVVYRVVVDGPEAVEITNGRTKHTKAFDTLDLNALWGIVSALGCERYEPRTVEEDTIDFNMRVFAHCLSFLQQYNQR